MIKIFNQKLEFHETNFRTSPIKSHPYSVLLINKRLQNKKRKNHS